jgi:hypothetical protein
MIEDKETFEKLIHEGWQQEFTGWDFSFLSGRMVETPASWDYRQIVLDRIRSVQSLLDLDTGGGEFLESLQPFPPETCATEGRFITQQVGDRNCIRLNEVLGAQPDAFSAMWTLDLAAKQLEAGGFRILERKEEFPETEFKDIGAVVYYLKAIAWQVSDFSVEKYYDQLGEIHNTIQKTGKFSVAQHLFYLEAQKK